MSQYSMIYSASPTISEEQVEATTLLIASIQSVTNGSTAMTVSLDRLKMSKKWYPRAHIFYSTREDNDSNKYILQLRMYNL